MSVDAWALLQAQQAARPKPNATIRPMGGGLEKLDGIPMGPDQPGWADKIQPPADPGPAPVRGPAILAAQEVHTNNVGSNSRLAIYFGKIHGYYNVAVETAPDWDISGHIHIVSEQSLVEMLPVLAGVLKVKDLTGEFNVAQKEQSGVLEGVSGARQSDKKPRKVRAKTSIQSRDEDARTGSSPHSIGGTALRPGLTSSNEALPGRGVESDRQEQDPELVNHPLADPEVRKIIMQRAKENAYKKHVELRREHGLDNENDTRMGATGSNGR